LFLSLLSSWSNISVTLNTAMSKIKYQGMTTWHYSLGCCRVSNTDSPDSAHYRKLLNKYEILIVVEVLVLKGRVCDDIRNQKFDDVAYS
jgi:hypothetical protein